VREWVCFQSSETPPHTDGQSRILKPPYLILDFRFPIESVQCPLAVARDEVTLITQAMRLCSHRDSSPLPRCWREPGFGGVLNHFISYCDDVATKGRRRLRWELGAQNAEHIR
jgi:hypothetical protein